MLPESVPCEADLAILDVLQQHAGVELVVVTKDGERHHIWDIAIAYDAGSEWSRVTTNGSTALEDAEPAVFTTDEVAQIFVAGSRDAIYPVDQA